MKYAKRFLTLLLSLSLLLCLLVGCDETSEENGGGEKTTFLRLSSVTRTYDGESVTYQVTWNGEACSFETGEGDYRTDFDTETNIFSIHFTDLSLPVFMYDENQTIIKLYNEDDPSESLNILYDEYGFPQVEGMDWYSGYDPEKRQVKVSSGGGSRTDEDGTWESYTNYEIRTFDKYGNISVCDGLKVTEKSDGTVTEETWKDYFKYIYDEHGNLLRAEGDGVVIEYQYTEEPIHHAWERIVPIFYMDFFMVYDLPLFWNLR